MIRIDAWRKEISLFILLVCIFVGCASIPDAKQEFLDLAKEGVFKDRRILIAHRYDKNEAFALAKAYQAMLYFAPKDELLAKGTESFLSHMVGPSSTIKHFIGNLQGMNDIGGKWEIIVPLGSFDFLITTFKYIDDNSLSNTDTIIYLIRASESWQKVFEREGQRISSGRMKIENIE